MKLEPPYVRDILVADDHPMVAEAMAALVRSRFPAAQLHLVSDFTAAVTAVAETAPQLALIDADMPDAAPRAGIAAILAAGPATRLIVVSGLRDDTLVDDLLAAGVAGFLPKMAPSAVMLAAIDLVLAGGRYRPEQLVLHSLSKAGALPQLSGRLNDVARLLGDGLTNKEIARSLGIGPETVKTYVAQLLVVLSAANRAEAAVKAQTERPSRTEPKRF